MISKLKYCVLISLLMVVLSFDALARSQNSSKQDPYVVSIPIPFGRINESDNHFRSLQQAFKHLNINVVFAEVPNARSMLQLRENKILGSYPRFAVVADNEDDFIALKHFGKPNKMFAYATSPIVKSKYQFDLKNNLRKFGVVRGGYVMQRHFKGKNVHWFAHSEHLMSALLAGRVDYMIILDSRAQLYIDNGMKLYQSSEPFYDGKVTLLLHKANQPIADRLDHYFRSQKETNL